MSSEYAIKKSSLKPFSLFGWFAAQNLGVNTLRQSSKIYFKMIIDKLIKSNFFLPAAFIHLLSAILVALKATVLSRVNCP